MNQLDEQLAKRIRILSEQVAAHVYDIVSGVMAHNIGVLDSFIEHNGIEIDYLIDFADGEDYVLLRIFNGMNGVEFYLSIKPAGRLYDPEAGWQFPEEIDDTYTVAYLDAPLRVRPDDHERRMRAENSLATIADHMPWDNLGETRRAQTLELARNGFSMGLPYRTVLDVTEKFDDDSNVPPLGETDCETILQHALAEACTLSRAKLPPKPERTEPFTKPVINYLPKNLTRVIDQIEDAILADTANGGVFARGGSYVTVRQAKAATAAEVQSGEAGVAVVTFDKGGLRERAAASVDFRTATTGKNPEWVQCPPSDIVLDTMLSRNGGNAPPLVDVITAPIVMPTGAVISRPGYDCSTGLFASFEDGKFPPLQSYTTERDAPRAQLDAEAALKWLYLNVFGEFPGRTETDRTAMVAAVMTGLLRPVCGITPGFLMSSGVQSTGKTTLMNVIGAIAHGVPPGLLSWPGGEEEMQKMILSSLHAGRNMIAFDNLKQGAVIGSNELAKLLSTPKVEGRLLGATKLLKLPANALVLLSGNNIVLEGDLPSRIIEIYLDAGMERPDQREFKRPDILEWALANRPEIVAKVLTIAKAYLDAGAPAVNIRPSRFSTFDQMVRRPLVWAGGADIGEKFSSAISEDPGLALLRDVLQQWRPALGTDPLPAGEVAAKLDAADFRPEMEAFNRSLRALIGNPRGAAPTAQGIGHTLKKFVSRPLDGLRLVGAFDKHLKSTLWSVEPTK